MRRLAHTLFCPNPLTLARWWSARLLTPTRTQMPTQGQPPKERAFLRWKEDTQQRLELDSMKDKWDRHMKEGGMRTIVHSGESLQGKSFFQRKDLSSSKFDKTLLEEADFRKTDLSRAEFDHADCTQAQFDHAALDRANFYRARLLNCEMEKVNLRRANLEFTELAGANLAGARLQGARFCKHAPSRSARPLRLAWSRRS